MRRLPACAALALCCSLAANLSRAVALPPSCATPPRDDTSTPLKVLRKRVESGMETDPRAAFALLCATIPRVERETGADSVELAWWVGSLATPMIAYMDKFNEALPALEFARPIFERHYGRYGEPLGDIHVAYAWIYTRQGRFADSAAAWVEALKVRERAPGAKKIELQKVLVGLALAQISLRDFSSAQMNLDRAHSILVQNRAETSEAGAAIENVLVNVAFRQERYQDARRHAEQQLRIENQLKGGAAQLVPAYALLGRILERLDEYEQAEQALRHAVSLAEGMQGPLQRHRVSALYQLAALLDQRGRPAEAREQAERALAVAESTLGPVAPRLVPLLQTLGDAEHQLGNLPEALHRFERAGAIVAAEKANMERPWLVDYYRDLGALQLSLGDAAGGENSLAAGLESAGDDPTLSIDRAQLLLDHARAPADLGGSNAQEEVQQALGLLRNRLPESHPSILGAVNELCTLELKASNGTPHCDEAARKLSSAHDIEPGMRAAIDDNQSRLALRLADMDGARRFAVRAVAAAESAATPDLLSQAYLQLAEVQSLQGQSEQAIFFGKQALAQIQRERSHFVGQDLHFEQGFLRDKVAAYRRVADWLLESGRIDEGLAVLSLMKTQELSDFGVRGALAPTERGIDFTREELGLRDRYSEAVGNAGSSSAEIARLSMLQERDRISTTETDLLHKLLADHDATEGDRTQRIETMLNGVVRDNIEPPRQRSIDTPALAHLANSFGPDAAFAVYLLSEDHLRILVNVKGHQAEFRSAIDGPQLRRDIGHFLDDIVQRHDAAALSRKLYGELALKVDQFARQYRVGHLVLWLDGPLRYLPIA
ncbi:MAG TPA: tetratricopeptide repeat protein, partial [Steroidobacteraceae bacterium]